MISVLLVTAEHVSAQVDLEALQDEAVGWLQEYIRTVSYTHLTLPPTPYV